MRKFIFLVILIVMTGHHLRAQDNHPVSWKVESEEIAPLTFKIHIRASIREPYHIYPQESAGGGLGMPTEIVFSENDQIELVGSPTEKGLETDEGEMVPHYTKGVTFTQTVKLRSETETELAFSVKFMACQGMMCLPPATKEFTLTLSPAQNDEAQEQRSASFNEFYAMWRGQNKMAPDFIAYDETGKAYKLSDFRGKVVVLDFWFTSCHMCIKGFPGMQEMAAKYRDQDLVVIAAGIPEKEEDFNAFVTANREKYPDFVWMQDRSTTRFRDCVANKDYGMFGAPSQVIIDKEGRVVGATNFKPQILSALPLAGIKVDEVELAAAQKEAKALEDRMGGSVDR